MQMDELACFVPGMLALGASGYGLEKDQKMMTLAKEVIDFLSFFGLFLGFLTLIVWLIGILQQFSRLYY